MPRPRAAEPRRARRLVQRHHPLTWTVVGLHLVVALAFSLLLPMFRGPDEAAHVDMVRRHRLQLGHDRPNQLVPLGQDVVTASDSVAPSAVLPRPPQLAEAAVPRPERPSFADLAPPGTPSGRSNHLTQHPPLYYTALATGSAFLGGLTPSGSWSWDRETYLYRLLSLLLTAPLPLLAAEAALAVRLSRRASAVAASALLLVPQATVITAGVNNDALVLLGSAGAVAASLWHLRRGSQLTAVLATSAAATAALSKATAAPLLVWVVLVVALRWWTSRRQHADDRTATGVDRRNVALTPGLVGSAGIAAVGFSWYVANLIRYRDPQPTGLRPLPSPESFEPSRFTFLHLWLDRLSLTYWGMPARRTGVALPWFLPHLLSVAAVGLAVAAWRDRGRRRATAILWLLCAAQVGLLMRSNWASHSRSGALPAVQGRYLYALLVPVAVLGVIGARQLAGGWPRALPRPSALWVGLALTMAGMALHLVLGVSMLRGFWGGSDASTWGRIAAVRAWSPLPSIATLGLLAAAVAATLAVVLVLVHRTVVELRRFRPSAPVDRDDRAAQPVD